MLIPTLPTTISVNDAQMLIALIIALADMMLRELRTVDMIFRTPVAMMMGPHHVPAQATYTAILRKNPTMLIPMERVPSSIIVTPMPRSIFFCLLEKLNAVFFDSGLAASSVVAESITLFDT